jgi:hypothetical protein
VRNFRMQLPSYGITFKNYNFHCPPNYSTLALFQKWAGGGPNNELNAAISDLTQCFTFG